MRPQLAIFIGAYLLSYVATLLIGFYCDAAPIANVLGLISLLCYVATLLPTILKTVLPSLKKQATLIWLLKYRRQIGIAAFGFAVNHGALLAIERNLNFLDWQTYIHYFQGLSSMTIFTILAITSNDETVRNLKKHWKKLHQLTYLVIFILPWHVLDKMAGHWTSVTPIAVGITGLMVGLFCYRKWRERQPQLAAKSPQISPPSAA